MCLVIDKDHQWNCLNYASRDFLLFSKLLTFSMLNSVDRPKGWNPVSELYDVYSWTSLGAITFLTTLGISSVSPSESFNFFVPFPKSCKKDGLETKSRKWSTFAGCSLLCLICGGSICWPGSLRKACFLASSILHFVRPRIQVDNSDFEWSQTKIESICCLVYHEFASS